MITKNTLISLGIGIVLGAILLFFLRKPEIKTIEVPVKIEVPVPVVEKQFDTIYYPKPIRVKDTSGNKELVEKYKKANDSLKQKLYESAVTEREYEEIFDDSIQTIKVNAKVTGVLNSLATSYKTKPRTIKVDTVISVDIPNKNRGIILYGELGVPITRNQVDMISSPVLKIGIDLVNHKNWVIGISADTEKRGWIKVGKKFNF